MDSETINLVNNVRLGFVATVNPDNTPNLSPKGTVLVLDKENLFFANIASPNTKRNLLLNPSAEVNVVDFFKRRGYRFKTVAEVVSRGINFDIAIKILNDLGIDTNAYNVDEIIILRVISYSQLFSPAYDIGKTEEELKDAFKKYYNEHL